MAIRDVKMMITIEDLLIVSPLEYIHFNSSIHLLPFFIIYFSFLMNTFLDKLKQLSVLTSAGNLQMAINFHKKCTYLSKKIFHSKIPQK